ncbi:class I SAM-dependent DNA methyltransferase [Pseudodesulfovibrio sp.]|uniref:class I SAM-dependent DNA methyltransferase n=1 Tax=unclassified Pseudodesulfovibrio TaxID=2661612 RepID=UPI003AFFF905
MQETPEIWIATYEAKTPEELSEAYRLWACDYDHDTCEGMGYVGPKVAADLLDRHLDSCKAKVLDAGCGTGLVGKSLNQMGYERLHAMDISKDMLAEAENKDVYDKLFQADMSRNLHIAADSYDATICVGAFTYAHVGPEAFDELARITRPGGYICFSLRDGAYQEYGYRQRLLALEENNVLELKEMLDTDYLSKEDVSAKYCICEVL